MTTEQEVLDRGNSLVERVLSRDLITKQCVIGRGIIDKGVSRLAETQPGKKLCLVSDETTWSVCGADLMETIKAQGLEVVEHWNMAAKPRPYADYELVEEVRDFLGAHGEAVPIAVGAGTINDLVKRASGELEMPYWVVGTAPSMDGYVASAASIRKNGFKQSMPCPAPVGAILDLNYLETAPAPMWGSGIGDIIGKISALADWLVADQMGVESVDSWIWELVEESLRDAVGNPEGVKDQTGEALAGLVVGCAMSGLSIQAYNASRPGSGGEHMFSHLWEMEGLGIHADPPLSHGYKVAVGAVAMAAFYDELLKMDLSKVDIEAQVAGILPWAEVEKQLDELHGHGPVRNAAQSQFCQKYASDEDTLRTRLGRLKMAWPRLRPRLREIMWPVEDVVSTLQIVDVPWHPEMIGLTIENLRRSYYRLRSSRNRYISFDMADEAGVLGEIIEKLFGPEGFWGKNPHAR